MTTAHSESSTERTPGRAWTIRLTGHADRSATVTCTTAACRMPPRSKDLPALRAFAAQHVAAHAKAATVRPNAACHCRAQRCATHEHTRVHCAGTVVLILRHDPTVGRVWTLGEVCESCAPLIANATILARAARTPAPAPAEAAKKIAVPAQSGVPGGFFSSPSAAPAGEPTRRRPGRAARPRRGAAQGR
ncbi:hypothetical protein [Streptomyces chryseus]|uniref:Uncharacterized protein n=1 Tax=Streptomyces chryseus TaxID=68186 RepID=A0ABQ3EAW3_9ACTN|nr:hypothetical protein [Streptomyces chryseus]GHB32038.1 hypothetical protein GCM10010346_64210 [Streptomyces chryseus]